MREKLKCIKDKCRYYFNSDDYFETCQLISKRVLLDKCYGVREIPNKKEEIACKIQKLIQEYEQLEGLERYIEENQGEK